MPVSASWSQLPVTSPLHTDISYNWNKECAMTNLNRNRKHLKRIVLSKKSCEMWARKWWNELSELKLQVQEELMITQSIQTTDIIVVSTHPFSEGHMLFAGYI